MRMDNERESLNVEDRRGRGGFGFPGGRRGGVVAGGGIGAVVIALLAMFLGVDPGTITGGGGGAPGYVETPAPRAPSSGQTTAQAPASEDAHARFVSRVLASTEDVWNAEFRRNGREYQPPRLVLFSGAVQSACGGATSASGPFYCPADQRVYIDLSFFRDMERKLGAGGDFAQAYVIAHEVGHHVQQLLGILPRTTEIQQRLGRNNPEANALSVRVELQADCLAGFWARRAQEMRGILERGDIEEGLNAAAAVGDDRISQGRAPRDSFTHGSSRERATWFRRGLEAGEVGACNTFG